MNFQLAGIWMILAALLFNLHLGFQGGRKLMLLASVCAALLAASNLWAAVT